MNISNDYNTTSDMAVSFNKQDRLDDKIDNCIWMARKLTAKIDKWVKQYKSQIYQRKRRGQARQNYDQGNYWNRIRSSSGDRWMNFRDIGRARNVQSYDKIMDKITDKIIGRCKITEIRIMEVDKKTVIGTHTEITMEMTIQVTALTEVRIIELDIEAVAETYTKTNIKTNTKTSIRTHTKTSI